MIVCAPFVAGDPFEMISLVATNAAIRQAPLIYIKLRVGMDSTSLPPTFAELDVYLKSTSGR